MKLVVGLGNPGRRYEQTRHNIGFVVADKLASVTNASPSKMRFDAAYAEALVGEKLLILWPQTFMNLSGKSVLQVCDFYKLPTENVLVVCDDMNLEGGRLRFRGSGSAGGQNGLADVTKRLGTNQIARLRIGIGRPPQGWDPADYVLGKFSKEETVVMEEAAEMAAKAILDWCVRGADFVMNQYNGKPKTE